MSIFYFTTKKLQFKKEEDIKTILRYFDSITESDYEGLKFFSNKKYTGIVKKEKISLKYAREYPIAYGLLCVLNVLLVDKVDYTQIEVKARVNILVLLFMTFCTCLVLYGYADSTPFLVAFFLTLLTPPLTYLIIRGMIRTTINKFREDMEYFENISLS